MPPSDAAKKAIRGYLETLRSLGERPVSIAAPDKALEKIIQEGRFRTQFETGESRGLFDPDYRAIAEDKLFNYPPNLPSSERPVYGHFSDRTLGPSLSATGYGDYNVVLDPARTKDATITLGDSLGLAPEALLRPEHGLGLPNRRALRESLRSGYPRPSHSLFREIERNSPGLTSESSLDNVRRLFQAPYIEAQVHRGVPWSDVRALVFNRRMNKHAADAAQSGLFKDVPSLWRHVDPFMADDLMRFARMGDVPAYVHQGAGDFGPKTWRKILPGMSDINEWKTIPEEALKEIGYRDGGVVQAFQKKGLVEPAAGWFSRLFGGAKRAPEPLPPAPEPQSSTRAMLEALRALEQRPVSIAVSEDPLRKIIEDGRFKTQFETQNSKGIFDPRVRAQREEQLFGLPPDLPPEHRPVYGHFSDRSLYGSERVRNYGRWNAVLDPARTKDATITLGDSLFERPEVVLRPGGIFSQQGRNALRKSSGQRDLLKFIRQEHGDTLPPDFTYGIEQIQKDLGAWAPYIEAQVHKGVPWNDVRALVYNSRLHGTPDQVMGGQMLDFANAGNVPVFAGQYVAPKQPLSWFRAEPGMKSPADILSVPEEALKEIGYRDGGAVQAFQSKGFVEPGKTAARWIEKFAERGYPVPHRSIDDWWHDQPIVEAARKRVQRRGGNPDPDYRPDLDHLPFAHVLPDLLPAAPSIKLGHDARTVQALTDYVGSDYWNMNNLLRKAKSPWDREVMDWMADYASRYGVHDTDKMMSVVNESLDALRAATANPLDLKFPVYRGASLRGDVDFGNQGALFTGKGIGSFSYNPQTAINFRRRSEDRVPVYVRVNPSSAMNPLRGLDVRDINHYESEVLMHPNQTFKPSYVAYDPDLNTFMLEFNARPHAPPENAPTVWQEGGHVESFDEGGQKGALRPTLAQIPKKGFLRFVDDIADWFGGASRRAINEVNAEAAKTGMEAGRFGHGSAATGQEWVSVPGVGSPHSVNLARTPTPEDYARMYMLDPSDPESTGYLQFRRDMDARRLPEGFQVHSHPPISPSAQSYGDPNRIRLVIQGGDVGPLAPSIGDLQNWLQPWDLRRPDYSDPRFVSYITGSQPGALMALGAPDYGKGYVYSPGKSRLAPSALLKNAEDVNNQRGELFKAVQASPAVKEIATEYQNRNPSNMWAALHSLRLGQHDIPITYDKKTPYGIGYLEDAMGDLFRRLSSRGEDIGGLAEGGAVEHYDEGGQKGALRPTLGQVSTLGKGALRFVTDMYDTLSPMRQEMLDKIRASTMFGKPGKGREALMFGRDETGIPSLRGIAGDDLPIVGTKTHTDMPTWYDSYAGINPKWRFVGAHTHPNDTISPSIGDLMIWSNYGRDPTKTAYQDMLIAAHPRGGLLQVGALDRTGLNPAQRMAARNDIIGEEMKATQRPNSLLKQHANAYTQFLKAHGLDVPVTPYKATFNDLEAGPLLDYMAGRHKVPITLDAATMLPGTDARLRDVWEEFIPFAQKMNIPVYSNYAHGGPVQHFGIGDVVEEVAKGALRRFTGARRTREAERLAAEEAALNAARDKKSPAILLPPEPRLQTVNDPVRLSYPGIYKDPRDIVQEAMLPGRLIPDPGRQGSMYRLFGVDRQDLDALSQGRPLEQMRPWPLQQAYHVAPGGTGSSISEQVLNPRNMRRLLDVTAESLKYPELAQTRSWYEMLPLWQRADYLGVSPEEQKLLNMRMALHSAGASPVSEVNRGTLAHMLAQQGRLEDFVQLGGTAAGARGPNFPADMLDMSSHAYHKTAHVPGLIDIEATGRMWSPKHKVPTYTAATDPVFPNYTRPVADSHFARGLGYPDVRTAGSQANLFKELSNPEYDDLLPWWDKLTEKSGLRPIGNQALLWNVMGPQTGVRYIGKPKLEMFSDQVMKAARRLGVTPETARDLVITGKAGAFAEGGPVGYYEAGGQVGNVGNVGDPGTLGSDRVPFFDFQTPGENEGPLSALASNNVQGYAGGGTVNGYAQGGNDGLPAYDPDFWDTYESIMPPPETYDRFTHTPAEKRVVRERAAAENAARLAGYEADARDFWSNELDNLRAVGYHPAKYGAGALHRIGRAISPTGPSVEDIVTHLSPDPGFRHEYGPVAAPLDLLGMGANILGAGGMLGRVTKPLLTAARPAMSRMVAPTYAPVAAEFAQERAGYATGGPVNINYPNGGQVPGYRFGGEFDQWYGEPGVSMYAGGGQVGQPDVIEYASNYNHGMTPDSYEDGAPRFNVNGALRALGDLVYAGEPGQKNIGNYYISRSDPQVATGEMPQEGYVKTYPQQRSFRPMPDEIDPRYHSRDKSMARSDMLYNFDHGGPVEMKEGGFLHDVLGTLGGLAGNLIPIPIVGPAIGKFFGHTVGNLVEGNPGEIGDDAGRDFTMGMYDADNGGFRPERILSAIGGLRGRDPGAPVISDSIQNFMAKGGSVDDDALLYHAIDTQNFSRGGALRYCGGGYAR